jgi:hypothetical protein
MPEKAIAKVEDAARLGNSSVFITGVDPGFATDLVPFAIAGTCRRIDQIKTMEIADYATYDGTEVLSVVMGFGNPLAQPGMVFLPGVLAARGAPRSGCWPPAWVCRSTRSPRATNWSPHPRTSRWPPA